MAEPEETLSDREQEVLRLVMQGARNKEVAAELHISENTVKVHLKNINAKLGTSSRTEASMVAVERNLLDDDEEEEEEEQERELEGKADAALDAADVSEAKNEEGAAVAEIAVPEPSSQRRYVAWTAGVGLLLLTIFGFTFFLEPVSSFLNGVEPTPTLFVEVELNGGRWFRSHPIPKAGAHMALATSGTDLYQIGGEDESGVSSAVYAYETDQLVWREVESKPTAVADATAAVLLEIYVPGGRGADGEPTAVVEAYSPASDRWRPVASLPKPIMGGLTLSDNRALYLFGGSDGERVSSEAFRYDPLSNNWSILPPMQHARAFAAGGLVDGKFYVVGGWDGEQALNVCEFFDPDTDSWSECPAMVEPRSGAGAAVVLDVLYVIGGEDAASSNFSEAFDPNSEEWQIINVPTEEATADTVGWSHLGVASVETRIYALGGRYADNTLSDENFVYSPLVFQTFIPAASRGNDE